MLDLTSVTELLAEWEAWIVSVAGKDPPDRRTIDVQRKRGSSKQKLHSSYRHPKVGQVVRHPCVEPGADQSFLCAISV